MVYRMPKRSTLKSKVREKWTEKREMRKDWGKQPIKREREFYIADIKFQWFVKFIYEGTFI